MARSATALTEPDPTRRTALHEDPPSAKATAMMRCATSVLPDLRAERASWASWVQTSVVTACTPADCTALRVSETGCRAGGGGTKGGGVIRDVSAGKHACGC